MQFVLGKSALSRYTRYVRVTHPNLLNLPLFAAALIVLNPIRAVAADLVFADGKPWMDDGDRPPAAHQLVGAVHADVYVCAAAAAALREGHRPAVHE